MSPPDRPGPLDRAREERARLALRILAQLPSPPLPPGLAIAPPEATQEGLAHALGVSQSAVSKILARLAIAGLLRDRSVHVAGHPRRVRAYYLTHDGEEFARSARHLEPQGAFPAGSVPSPPAPVASDRSHA